MFRRFQTRLTALFGGLLVALTAAVLLVVDGAQTAAARREVDRGLTVTAGVLSRVLADRTATLVHAAELLSADFAFKSAVATDDRATTVSALDNHAQRIGADRMLLVGLDGAVLADTLHDAAETPLDPALEPLLAAADEDPDGRASGFAVLDGRALQLVDVPLLAPIPIAHIVVGFELGDALARDLAGITRSEVTLLAPADGEQHRVVASSLPASTHASLAHLLDASPSAAVDLAGTEASLDVENESRRYALRTIALGGTTAGGRLHAQLAQSLDEALAPSRQLRRLLGGLFVAGVLLALALAAAVARGVTRPVQALATAATRVRGGDLSPRVAVAQRDELGLLADAFNGMVEGLAERDRVRDLLGKVVSPEIAQELLGRGVELGGEERRVTVLFSDVRGFTTLCEGRSPREVLALLNRYLTRMSAVVEANGGVVDKYVGDAIMALFGAPIDRPDDADRAVATALGMVDALGELNRELAAEGLPALAIGVGIHTDLVVAGNMGSTSRLNYTVIGDGVNLASRLEGITKRYGVPVVVSAATAALASSFVCRELDRVRVKGKQEAVTIYAPWRRRATLDADGERRLATFEQAVTACRERDFVGAARSFETLAPPGDDPVVAGWAQRCREWLAAPPPADWDGTTTLTEK